MYVYTLAQSSSSEVELAGLEPAQILFSVAPERQHSQILLNWVTAFLFSHTAATT